MLISQSEIMNKNEKRKYSALNSSLTQYRSSDNTELDIIEVSAKPKNGSFKTIDPLNNSNTIIPRVNNS